MKKVSAAGITAIIFTTVILLALIIGDVGDNIRAFGRILSMEGILLSDAIGINRGYGGIMNGLFLNVFLTVATALVMVKLSKASFEGPVIAGIFTIAGFSFVGKNVWNVLPIYLGVFLYAKFMHKPLKEVITPVLFATAISPLVSFMVFGTGMQHLDLWIRIGLAIGAGVAAGFFAPMIAISAAKFHGGFNLYNIGFTMGLIAVIAHGTLRKLGIHVQFVGVPVADFPDYTLFLMGLIALLAVAAISWAVVHDRHVMSKYKLILKETGRAPTNFNEIAGTEAVLFNMGVLALICLVLIVPLLFMENIPFLGVFGASTLTIIGFGAFGKHPFNTLPIIAGTFIGFFVIRWIDSPYTLINPTANPYGPYYSSLNIHVFVSAIFFATCLAPISKEYGWKAGIITGIVHMSLVMTARSFQGGFNLYNNGWAAGFIGGILVPIFESFRSRPGKVKAPTAAKEPFWKNLKRKEVSAQSH